jgi:FixJ family two-component response regulator
MDTEGCEIQPRSGHPHVVFITGHGDIPSTVRAMKLGAVDFLTKPFREADLMRAIDAALAQNRDAMNNQAALGDLRRRLSKSDIPQTRRTASCRQWAPQQASRG